MKKQNGFTLVEAVIALFIGSLMLVAVYETINMGQISSSKVERRISAQQDVRGALELMAMEIQMASYNPTLECKIWVSPTDCASPSSNMTYRGIQAATANSITIEMDVNGTGVINTTSNPNEIITYAYDSTNQYITRSTNCGSAQPFLGATTASGAATQTVLVVNNTAGPSNAAIPVFRYYAGDGSLLTPDGTGSIGVNIPNIRRVEITLVVKTSSTNVGNAQRQFVYSTSVIPRNHVVPCTN